MELAREHAAGEVADDAGLDVGVACDARGGQGVAWTTSTMRSRKRFVFLLEVALEVGAGTAEEMRQGQSSWRERIVTVNLPRARPSSKRLPKAEGRKAEKGQTKTREGAQKHHS